MADVDWQPLPPLWPEPAVWTDVGEFMLLVFTQDGVPTWEVSRRPKAGSSLEDPIATALLTRLRRQRQPHSSKQRCDPQNEEFPIPIKMLIDIRGFRGFLLSHLSAAVPPQLREKAVQLFRRQGKCVPPVLLAQLQRLRQPTVPDQLPPRHELVNGEVQGDAAQGVGITDQPGGGLNPQLQ